MITTTEVLDLPDGKWPAQVDKYEETDRIAFEEIYRNWRNLCTRLEAIGARKVNLPDGLSECAFCYFFGFWRTSYGIPGATHTSFDAYDPINHQRIQIKGGSIAQDLTSFGPDSVWDVLYFVDFYKEGKWDYTFDVYIIDNDDIYSQKVNKTQTFREQQAQGRRPRFSVKAKIIEAKNLKPQYTCDIKSGQLIKHF